jgi:hypothetical protein
LVFVDSIAAPGLLILFSLFHVYSHVLCPTPYAISQICVPSR